jgi:primosomal protein N' (replication factor Y)
MPVPLHRTFDYSVPQDAAPVVRGSRIRANFANRNLVGIVVECDPEDAHADLKPIRKSLDAVPCASEELLDLATWLAGYYHHPIGEVLHTMLPSAALKGDPLTWNPEHVWSVRSEADETILARAPRQQALFEYLRSREATSARTVREAGFSTAQLNALIDKQLIEIAQPPAGESPLNLNAEQSQALSALKPDISGYRTTLIDGVTGSGKTEVYLQAIAEVVRTGRQVLVLVPEIALTPQTLARFQRRFPRTAVMHSNLSDSARLATWLRARDGDIQILIGTRSAVFTPFADLGLIVVDEEHDASFKQSDGLRYSARDVATKRGRDLDIPVILGSATPALETLNNALTGRYGHVQLTHRAGGAGMPQWHLIDVRGHTLDQGISPPLDRVISSHLNDGNQVLIFLNRRGYAPSFLCSHCKWRAGCEACDAAARVVMARVCLQWELALSGLKKGCAAVTLMWTSTALTATPCAPRNASKHN